MYIYIYIYIYTNLPVSAIVRIPHPRSGDSYGQETFLAPSADRQTRNHETSIYIVYIYIYIYILYTNFEFFLYKCQIYVNIQGDIFLKIGDISSLTNLQRTVANKKCKNK